jgi:hypothetical protein
VCVLVAVKLLAGPIVDTDITLLLSTLLAVKVKK